MTFSSDSTEQQLWREQIVEIARAILDGRMEVAVGIFNLDYYCTCLDPKLLSEVTCGIKGVCSELGTIPHPNQRHRYSSELLARSDESLEFYRDRIKELCAEMVRMYGPEY